MSQPQWTIPELIDLEFFLDQDEGEDLDRLAARDREIYTRRVGDCRAEKSSSALLMCWLASQRNKFAASSEDVVSPGRVWQEGMTLFGWLSVFAGLVSGAGLAFSFLSYSGKNPVNVSAYFALFVLVQVALILALTGIYLYRKVMGKTLAGSLVYRMLSRAFLRLTELIERKGISRISAEKRRQWSALAGGWRALQQRYGTLLLRPFFLIAQLFGLSFNGGVLAATLLKVVGFDIAFGWQTSLQVSGEAVHKLVAVISLPWSWAVPAGCPTLSQVQGSQMVLKNGIYHLITSDLVSWWPFLCFAVFCYGLLPRLIFFLYGLFLQHRELSALDFDHGRYRQLLHRMKTPLVSTRGQAEEGQKPLPLRQEASAPASSLNITEQIDHKVPEEGSARISEKIAGLIPDELVEECSFSALKAQVKARLGYELITLQAFWGMDKTEEEEIAALLKKMREHHCEDILLLQEAWQPPIQENLSFLSMVRKAVGSQPTIILALIGKPAADTFLTPVDIANFRIWQQRVASLADSGLQLVELVK